MGIFDLIGAGAAGAMRGAVQGEQAKIQYLRQGEQDAANQKYRQDQLDLNRLRLQKEGERALSESHDRTRDLYMKGAIASLEFFNNAQNAADHDFQAQKTGGVSSIQLRQELSKVIQDIAAGVDPGKIKFPVPRVLQKIAAGEMGGQAQPQAPQEHYPPGATTNFNPGEQSAMFGQPGPDFVNSVASVPEIPNLRPDMRPVQQEGVSLVPPRSAAPGFVPQPQKTAAEITYRGAQTERQRTGAAYDEARTAKVDAETPFVKPLADSLIGLRGAQKKQAEATAAATPVRVANDTKKVVDQIRKTDETIRNNRANNEISRRRVANAEAATAVLNDLRRMQTVNTGQDAAMMEVKIRRLADSLPPDQAKVLNAWAGKMMAYDPLKGEWAKNQEAIDNVQAIMQGLSNAPQATGGATTGTGGAIQGAPSNASLSTQNATASKGTAGTSRTTTQGNYKASWQVNRGATGGKAAPNANAEIKEAVASPEVRKKVEDLAGDPAAFKKWKSGLNMTAQKAVGIIEQELSKKRKAQAKPAPKPKTGTPNLMQAPRR